MTQVSRPLYDIHSHILPDIDDGAADLDVTLAMLRTSAERGVTSIVATPHSYAVAERLPLDQSRSTVGGTAA